MTTFDTKGFIKAARDRGINDSEIRAYLENRGTVPQATSTQTQRQVSGFDPGIGLDTAQRTNLQTEPTQGFFKSVGSAMISGTKGFGESIAGAIDPTLGKFGGTGIAQRGQEGLLEQQQAVVSRIQQARQQGEDTTQLQNALTQSIQEVLNSPQADEINPALNKTNRQVIAEAVETGVMALSGGLLGAGVKTAAGKFAPSLVKQGAVTGGLLGGATAGQQEEASLGSVAGGASIGAGLGAGTALALKGVGAGVNKISSIRQARIERTNELKSFLSDPNTPISQRLAERTGGQPLSEVVGKDPTIKEAVNQGVDAGQAFLIKHSDKPTKGQMQKMLDIAKRSFQNPASKERSLDVAGESFMKRFNHIETQRQIVGKQLYTTAQSLKGKQVDFTPAFNSLSEDLASANIRVDQKGQLLFDGSNFEGITGAQKALIQIWNRAQKVDDAFSAHQLKGFIDNQVDFGKTKTGLTGSAERILKSFRANLDVQLDQAFPEYNTLNTQYARLAQIRDEVKRLVKVKSGNVADIPGTDINPAEMKAGHVMRRILQENPNRGDILKLIDEMETVTRQTGGKVSDDMVALVTFADALEDTFGTQAAASLQAQFRRGITQKAVGEVLGSSFNLQGIRTAIGNTVERARGINHANRVKAIEQLLSQ